jgi:transposase
MKTEITKEINEKELDELIERIQAAIDNDLSLSVADMQLLLNALMTLAHLHERMADNDITLHKLRKLAGIVNASEKFKNIAPGSLKGKKKKKTSPGNSKNKSRGDASSEVEHQCCHHKLEGDQKGQICPECERGKLYKYEPATHFRISGQSPLLCTKHIIERLRCNACGVYFTAPTTEEARQDGSVQQTYGYSARALMAIYKYYAGNPFYRQQSLQNLFAMPVSASTVFDQCEHLANDVQPVMQHLMTLSASAVHYHLDDTTNRILNQGTIDKPDRKTGKLKKRSGIYTSGIIATLKEAQQVVLFQTNIGHAGEWIDEILMQRPSGVSPLLVMCDALSRNFPTKIKDYHLTLCNAHARREFVDVFHHFPDKVNWVLERYGGIWENDDYCKTHDLSPQARCDHHAEQSLPIMEAIRLWAEQQLDTEQVEENSGLGKAMAYYLRHFEALTGFCRIPGAQLDNNEMEAALKLIIRGRKNSLFFKTLAGAAVADVLTSLIATSVKAGINVFDYFVILQRHADEVKNSPQLYLPWNYQMTLKENQSK